MAYRRICKHINFEITDLDPQKKKKKGENLRKLNQGRNSRRSFRYLIKKWTLPKAKLQEILDLVFIFVQRASHTTKNSPEITRQKGIYSTNQTFGKSLQVAFFEFLKTIQ
jgi:hypothetical protein